MKHLAIVGSGASGIYLLKHLLDHVARLPLQRIDIFEKFPVMGMGMPYSPLTTEVHNLSNIASEELPALPVTLVDWLRAQDPETLRELRVDPAGISAHEIYSRLALGRYLHAQYRTLIAGLSAGGVEIREHPGCRICDLRDDAAKSRVTLVTEAGEEVNGDRVIIATGHSWPSDDEAANGCFASPWPIFKLLPAPGEYLNFPIATIGASLSAFDVVSSLAHHHGEFLKDEGKLRFHPHPGTECFRLEMHSVKGLLPHLQYEQDRPIREIYRHAGRTEMLALTDPEGFLRLGEFFDFICRPVLHTAFVADKMPEEAALLDDLSFSMEAFIEKMTAQHEYHDAFKGMEEELKVAREAVAKGRPMHWQEVLDDLLYMLNYHAELLSAEDQLVLKGKLMPFVMNIVAALPLPSAEILLALRAAGKLELISGEAKLVKSADGMTTLSVEHEGKTEETDYRMLVDCRGQKPLELADYPFPSLVTAENVRAASAPFRDAAAQVPEGKEDLVISTAEGPRLLTGGVEIDAIYRLVGADGTSNPRLYDIAFPHTSGVRPYSYGLQACSDTAEIVVRAWCEERENAKDDQGDLGEASLIYEKI